MNTLRNPGVHTPDCPLTVSPLTIDIKLKDTHIHFVTVLQNTLITLKYPLLPNLQEECVSWTAGTQVRGRNERSKLLSKRQLTTLPSSHS